MNKTYFIDIKYACFGIETRDNVCTDAAPIINLAKRTVCL